MGKVKRLELWWQLYVTWLTVRDSENFRPLDFWWTEGTCWYVCLLSQLCSYCGTESTPIPLMFSMCYRYIHVTLHTISHACLLFLCPFTYVFLKFSQSWFSIVLTTMSQFFLLLCFSCLFFPFLARTHAHMHTHFIGCCLSNNPTVHSWTPHVHSAVVSRYQVQVP
jgi:hypothetical protein